jgi:zeaxanthin glucosyltransferase
VRCRKNVRIPLTREGAELSMSRIGFFCFVGTGHLNPAIGLGGQLAARGHEVTIFHTAIAKGSVRKSGLNFWQIEDPIEGTPRQQLLHTGKRGSWIAPRSVLFAETVRENAYRVLRAGRDAVRKAGMQALVIDQADLAAGSVADFLGLPFVTLSTFPPVVLDAYSPPTFFDWDPDTTYSSLLRNRIGNALVRYMASPVIRMVNATRRDWGLAPFRNLDEMFSQQPVITVLPEAFDFPRTRRPFNLLYTGPFRRNENRMMGDFPWEKLDGRPLVYASLGTIQNNHPGVFRTIADACSALNVQLVLSLGGGRLLPEDFESLPGDPLVVHYAPQLHLLQMARLTITHAGLNTTLESLAAGVPMVAIPLANDEFGVAARIKWTQTGAVLSLKHLSKIGLRNLIQRVLEDPKYRFAAQRMKAAIEKINGAETAAGIIEAQIRSTEIVREPRS